MNSEDREVLIRIADALEGINDSLSNMDLSLNSIDSDLSKCISRTERGNLLCITGNVSTN